VPCGTVQTRCSLLPADPKCKPTSGRAQGWGAAGPGTRITRQLCPTHLSYRMADDVVDYGGTSDSDSERDKVPSRLPALAGSCIFA
jgi:hypothetical protein